MKLKTHYAFSTGLLALIDSAFYHNIFAMLVFIGVLSILANALIDKIGHEMVTTKNGYTFPRRTPLTHTIPRSILWGFLVTIPFIALFYYVLPFTTFTKYLGLLVLDGIIVGPSHMLLDVFTEKGIYVKRDGKWQRFALAHFRYNDPIANGLAGLLGVIMIFIAISH